MVNLTPKLVEKKPSLIFYSAPAGGGRLFNELDSIP
jgi:hypothetical protein